MMYVVYYNTYVSLPRAVFFQAEDGIRDLVRSRGLGDVYKRQEIDKARAVVAGATTLDALTAIDVGPPDQPDRYGPVSYTHLPLPTSDLV